MERNHAQSSMMVSAGNVRELKVVLETAVIYERRVGKARRPELARKRGRERKSRPPVGLSLLRGATDLSGWPRSGATSTKVPTIQLGEDPGGGSVFSPRRRSLASSPPRPITVHLLPANRHHRPQHRHAQERDPHAHAGARRFHRGVLQFC